MREAKSVQSGTSGTHRARERVAAGACQVVGGGMDDRSNKSQIWETCLAGKERSSCRLERPKNRAVVGVRASIVAQASREVSRTGRTDRRRVMIAGAKGTQENGMRRNKDE